MIKEKSAQHWSVILVMGLLTAIGPLSIDMYLPAFPEIAADLRTTVAEISLSLSSFFIGISAGQLLYGPLLERYGRKRPLYAGLCLYFLAASGCALSRSPEMLIWFRFFQAIGGCVGMVAARAMVRDLFSVKDNARIFSLLVLVVSVSPILAPAFGGFITTALGWRYVFVALIVVVLLILAGTYFILPESKAPDPAFSLAPVPILRHFTAILKDPQFQVYAVAGSVSYGGLYAYVSGSPYVFMILHGVNRQQFGWIFAIIAAGLISASQANNLALRKFSNEQVIRFASLSQTVIGLLMVLSVVLAWDNLYLVMVLIFFFLACQGFIFPNATALALAPMGNQAGNASALIGTIQMSIGASASALVSVLEHQSALPMTAVMCSCALVAFIIFSSGQRRASRRAAKELVLQEEVETITDF
ncbi:multidrug effflux MFS transporter [Flavihumibacter petaseus]|uniref:Putative drug transporter n=1 Tax=Flavihumibacter petaseus NBRC 106054 TaxID=1220578 RepID=A0A0E9N1V3_9BACT|nr:multidrug effflux MFS transporter [Flavihumibacter petaseus]GAO43997.1 putative drug transporter [Flavihumibacter petaseus NBRC 106054]